uniref:Uncharacterized protein n=1 Tax=Chromera velia CCMP2878 TaxID=1169474 RepID=A0A0G4FN50_9ALVE|eukprot:Cvel_17870.t1-p1 / transcript=Cvel_17870.t1 / gene=Cvel_17870 / organism=Chromera_velia_CCMP2878 / gene_product=hypothetical protein / transcript_product=hypothetical protein / location=Cvel_scaffold1449:29047-30156(+) / protein_length=232 / sequence_SO=supercontig / SO=protein_coding / is_pseudo=false
MEVDNDPVSVLPITGGITSHVNNTGPLSPGTRRVPASYRQRIVKQWFELFLLPVFERKKLFPVWTGIRAYDRCWFKWKSWGDGEENGNGDPFGNVPFADERGDAPLWVCAELLSARRAVSEALRESKEWSELLGPVSGNPLVVKPVRVAHIAVEKFSPKKWESLYVQLQKAASVMDGWVRLRGDICASPMSFLEGDLESVFTLTESDWGRVREKESKYERQSEEVMLIGDLS